MQGAICERDWAGSPRHWKGPDNDGGGGRSQRDVKFHPCHRDVSYWPQMSRVINAYFSESHNNLICKSLSFAVNLRTYKKSRKLGGIAAVARRFT